jgi:hypothetical protein
MNELKIGQYTIKHIAFLDQEPLLCISHESGEGMTIEGEKLIKLIDELWKDF